MTQSRWSRHRRRKKFATFSEHWLALWLSLTTPTAGTPAGGQVLPDRRRRRIRAQDGWRIGTADDYLQSVQLGICPMICPDHSRHCDAYGDGRVHNLGHLDAHACANCDGWRPR
jgi:hypothetical protein